MRPVAAVSLGLDPQHRLTGADDRKAASGEPQLLGPAAGRVPSAAWFVPTKRLTLRIRVHSEIIQRDEEFEKIVF